MTPRILPVLGSVPVGRWGPAYERASKARQKSGFSNEHDEMETKKSKCTKVAANWAPKPLTCEKYGTAEEIESASRLHLENSVLPY